MIELKFFEYNNQGSVDYVNTITTLKQNINIDPIAISGVDYFATESRKCDVEFIADDWVKNNFVDDWQFLGDSKYNYYGFRLIEDDEIKYTGFVKPTNRKYNRKTEWIKLSATDIIGLLLEVADENKDYMGTYDIHNLLWITLSDVLDMTNVAITDNSDSISIAVDDSPIDYSYKNYFENCEASGLEFIPPSPTQYPKYKARIRDINWNYFGRYFEFRMCDFDAVQTPGNNQWSQSIKYLYLKFDTDLIFDEVVFETNGFYSPDHNVLFENWLSTDYGTEEMSNSAMGIDWNNKLAKVELKKDSDNNDTIDLLFSGTVEVEKIKIGDPETGIESVNRKELIKAMLLYLNAGMWGTEKGNIIIDDKSGVDTSNAIDIDNYVFEDEIGSILYRAKDFSSDFAFLRIYQNVANALETYYNNLYETFRAEIEIILRDTAPISYGDTIKRENKYYKIAEIDSPLWENIVKIKAWGEE